MSTFWQKNQKINTFGRLVWVWFVFGTPKYLVFCSFRGCISAQFCAHIFIFCTYFPPTTTISSTSCKSTSQILSFHTFPRSDVFWKIWEASLWLPNFCELIGVLTPNLGSSFFTRHHSSGTQYDPSRGQHQTSRGQHQTSWGQHQTCQNRHQMRVTSSVANKADDVAWRMQILLW